MGDVKRWAVEVTGFDVDRGMTYQERVNVVPAADFDRLLAERDRLREAGDALADVVKAEPSESASAEEYEVWRDKKATALAAWREATGGGE